MNCSKCGDKAGSGNIEITGIKLVPTSSFKVENALVDRMSEIIRAADTLARAGKNAPAKTNTINTRTVHVAGKEWREFQVALAAYEKTRKL